MNESVAVRLTGFETRHYIRQRLMLALPTIAMPKLDPSSFVPPIFSLSILRDSALLVQPAAGEGAPDEQCLSDRRVPHCVYLRVTFASSSQVTTVDNITLQITEMHDLLIAHLAKKI